MKTIKLKTAMALYFGLVTRIDQSRVIQNKDHVTYKLNIKVTIGIQAMLHMCFSLDEVIL